MRARLFRPTLVAIPWNPVIRNFYRHLLEQGKDRMTVIIAATHKLLTILNTILKSNQSLIIKNA